MDSESAAPSGGFTFADKRKVNSDGTVRTPTTGSGEAAAAASPGAETAASGPASPDTGGGSSSTESPVDISAAEDIVVEEPIDPQAALAEERLADLQRLQAEYANYRKRVDRDRGVARESAIGSVIESLLPVLDDIHLARQHGDLESGPFVSIADKLEGVLAKYGVERYGSVGEPFDPAVHEALMHSDEELAEGTDVTTVVGVLQPGYRVGEKVLRPARVSVADPS